MKASVGLVDNGGANLASIRHALKRLGVDTVRVTDAETLRGMERVILPGVGAAADAMRRLHEHDLIEAIRDYQRPLLGICLGLQLLYDTSGEGNVPCLGLLPGKVEAIPNDIGVTVPHMGWNRIAIRNDHDVLQGLTADDWFYFVHGFVAPVNGDTLASTNHGVDFTAVAGRDNIIAAQFHPERSGFAGAQFLANFLEWQP